MNVGTTELMQYDINSSSNLKQSTGKRERDEENYKRNYHLHIKNNKNDHNYNAIKL